MTEGRPQATGGLFLVRDIKAYLAGSWSLERTVFDELRGEQGTLSGSAQFSEEGADLLYREDGILLFGGLQSETFRIYRYCFPEMQRAEILFEDGSFFHDLNLKTGVWDAEHACGDDAYCGHFKTISAVSWSSRWSIEGPRKQMTIASVYRRQKS